MLDARAGIEPAYRDFQLCQIDHFLIRINKIECEFSFESSWFHPRFVLLVTIEFTSEILPQNSAKVTTGGYLK